MLDTKAPNLLKSYFMAPHGTVTEKNNLLIISKGYDLVILNENGKLQ